MLNKNVLLGEQPVSKAGIVGSNPTVLADNFQEGLLSPVTLPVLATRLSSGRDGFDSRTGRFVPAVAER